MTLCVCAVYQMMYMWALHTNYRHFRIHAFPVFPSRFVSVIYFNLEVKSRFSLTAVLSSTLIKMRLSAIFAALAAVGEAYTTYYVSSSNTLASDSNPGTSPALPWRTLERVQLVAPSLGPNDAVLLRAGDAFNISDSWYLSGMWGAPGSEVVISAYVDDGAGVDRPRIWRAEPPAHGPVITVDNSSSVLISGLEIAGGENGIAFTYDVPGPYQDIAVTDCYLHDIRTTVAPNASVISSSFAIGIGARLGGVVVRNVTVANNIIANCDAAYYNGLPYAGFTRAYVAGASIRGNLLQSVAFNSIFVDTTEGVSIAGNVMLHDTPDTLFLYGTTDIILGTLNASTSIVGNEIGWRGEYPNGPDGCSIDFETQSTGVQVRGNYIHHSYGAGIMVMGHTTTSTELLFEGNIMLYNGCNQTREDRGGISFLHLNSSGTITGNTFATCPDVPLFYPAAGPHALDNWVIEGNLVDGENGTIAVLPEPVVTAATGPDGSLQLTATPGATSYGQQLRYTLDGSRPTASSPLWPQAGLALPGRSTAVLVKAFPVAAPRSGQAPVSQIIESPSAGGVFSP